ncbi:phosphoribosylanthranilate isomerase [Helicobacter aurati]|uniref:N-(5'-phosphoribosyl)anthranilate isomerase n=1 Tax=Helicobacter aurati TaxID=137778 RepID=A0A3D8J799_9HELI|nr:phosphoribosylanthranilate isomerase [Helicobacter aurati]RDU72721.1 phosphoribosylanthranilate isomerase [Helicobacter aurati]
MSIQSKKQFSDIEILEKICQTKLAKMRSLGCNLGHNISNERNVPLIQPSLLHTRNMPLSACSNISFTTQINNESIRNIRTNNPESFIIAEIKRASPTQGRIASIPNPLSLVGEYLKQGANAISVLCEEDYFQGSLKDLQNIKTTFPYSCILRKDFILQKEEIANSYFAGADMVLLIAGIFLNNFKDFEEIYKETLKFNLTPLIEVHNDEEWDCVAKLNLEKAIIGINSRNLRNFQINQMNALRLRAKIPQHIPVIFESGIHSPSECFMIANSGFAGILCGSFLVSSLMPQIDSKQVHNTSISDFHKALQQGAINVGMQSHELKMAQPQTYQPFYQKLLLRSYNKNQIWQKLQKSPTNQIANSFKDSRRNSNTFSLPTQIPLVKVCGINNLEFLEAAIPKADLLGFILTEKSVRFVDKDFVQKANEKLHQYYDGDMQDPSIRIIPPLRIGVVLSNSLAIGLELLELGMLDALQLHNISHITKEDSSPTHYFPHYPALKIESFLNNNRHNSSHAYNIHTSQTWILWDSSEGQNNLLDRKKLSQLTESFPHFQNNLWLAGGINKTNLADILTLNPMLIDICSGFENEKGIKDNQKLESFFEEFNRLYKLPTNF